MLSKALPVGPVWDEGYSRNRLRAGRHRSETCDWHQWTWSKTRREKLNMNICPCHRQAKSDKLEAPARVSNWEDELTNVLAAAELAFEQLMVRCGDPILH
jgi:hypothetical protein